MSSLLILVKLLTALYQAKKLKDTILTDEILDTYKGLKFTNNDLFTQDTKIQKSICETITWLNAQTDNESIIKSLLIQRTADFLKDAPELSIAVNVGLSDIEGEENARKAIYQHIKDIRKSREEDAYSKKFKTTLREFYFGDVKSFTSAQWGVLADLIEERTKAGNGEKPEELVESVDTGNLDTFTKIIQRSKDESSPDGILKMGLQGLNEALYPDLGLKRAKFYLINALTNRGKSLTMGHIIASVALYNKPKLRDKAKIPTILLDSLEDTLDMIIERIYKLVMVNKHGHQGDFQNTPPDEIASTIAHAFQENGWFLKINKIDPNTETYAKMTDRARVLEMEGHEIIFYGNDYLAMSNLDGLAGDSRSDKLQILFRRTRTFWINRGTCVVTPHQLNPDAKRYIREQDEGSDINFAKDIGGKSMTEGSTKLTNEVDGEITVHVVKTEDDKAYWTFYVGKQRGEGSPESKRFGIYPLDPVMGLIHDINGKATFRRSINRSAVGDGDVPDWDVIE